MVIYVDLDETLCNIPKENKLKPRNYSLAEPIGSAIDIINKFYDEGNKIIIWTARGAITGYNWKEITEMQLIKWGVKYHKLSFNKPFYDLLFDDKAMNINELILKKSYE